MIAPGVLLNKLAALALLAGLLVLSYQGLFAPIAHKLSDTRQKIEERRDELGRLTLALNEHQRDAVTDEPNIRALNFTMLDGESDQIRAAALQARVNAVAADEGIRLSSVTVLPPRVDDALRLVGIEIQLQTGLKQLQGLLFTLEAQQPPLFVGMLQITRAADSKVRPHRELDARLTLFGATTKSGGG